MKNSYVSFSKKEEVLKIALLNRNLIVRQSSIQMKVNHINDVKTSIQAKHYYNILGKNYSQIYLKPESHETEQSVQSDVTQVGQAPR